MWVCVCVCVCQPCVGALCTHVHVGVYVSVNDPVKWQAELAVRVQPTVREREGEEAGEYRSWWWCVSVCVFGGGGGGGGGQLLPCDSPRCHHGDRGPWVALSIPTWEACKWRGRAVIIYSLQHLTLDSELITAKGKSDWTWRVPEPVTLISVRCLQQEVREEELASVSSHCGFARVVCTCLCVAARWGVRRGGGSTAGWLSHDSRWHVVGLLTDLSTTGICGIITVYFAVASAKQRFVN